MPARGTDLNNRAASLAGIERSRSHALTTEFHHGREVVVHEGLYVLITGDQDLQAAIRYQLTAHRRAEAPKRPSSAGVIASLRKKQRKLLDLHYAEQIDAETFAVEHRHIVSQIKTLKQEAVDKFDQVAELLADFDAQRIWDSATATERWTLVKDLVDSVCIYPDRLTVQVAGAPPFVVALGEVGLKKGGITVVSEAH